VPGNRRAPATVRAGREEGRKGRAGRGRRTGQGGGRAQAVKRDLKHECGALRCARRTLMLELGRERRRSPLAQPASALASAAGSATLTINCRRRTGKPMTYARCTGSKSIVRMSSPDPFTSQRPAKPCTPRLRGFLARVAVDATADRGNRDRNAQPIRTLT